MRTVPPPRHRARPQRGSGASGAAATAPTRRPAPTLTAPGVGDRTDHDRAPGSEGQAVGMRRVTSIVAGAGANAPSTRPRASRSAVDDQQSGPALAGTASTAMAARRRRAQQPAGGHRHEKPQRGAGTAAKDAVEHAVGGGALELDLGAHLDAVAQRRLGHRLHLVGVTNGRPARPTPWPRAAAWWPRAATRRG